MFSFVGLLVIVGALATLMPLVSRGQGQAPFGARKFYLTQTEHNGSQALSACAAGYHMASLWEIHDPTYLRYNATLGYTKADSGSGLPGGPGSHGWIRTGGSDHSGPFPGSGNCLAWTSTADNGTVVSLSDIWDSPTLTKIDPWTPNAIPCSLGQRVWCVQD